MSSAGLDIERSSSWSDNHWMVVQCGLLTLESLQPYYGYMGSFCCEVSSKKLKLILLTKHIQLPQNLHRNSQLVSCCVTNNKTLILLVLCKRIIDDDEDKSAGNEQELWGVTYYDIQNEEVDRHYPSVVQRLTQNSSPQHSGFNMKVSI